MARHRTVSVERVEKANRLWNTGRTGMEKKGVSREQLKNTQRNLEQMKRNLDASEKQKRRCADRDHEEIQKTTASEIVLNAQGLR